MADLGFSIVVPTKDRPEQLSRCLAALATLRPAKLPHEILIVDDGSSTDLSSLIEPFRMATNVRLIRQENRGPASARNNGLFQSNARYVAFTDDDCCPEPDWLLRLEQTLEGHPGAAAGGTIVNALSANAFSTASQTLLHYLYEVWNRNPEQGHFFASNNVAFPRSGLLALGGFDESFSLAAAEDRDICTRWTASGLRLVYAPAAIVKHFHSLSFAKFFKQHSNYGRGAWEFWRKRKHAGEKGLRLEPLSFYTGMLRFPFGRDLEVSPLLVAILIALSQLWTWLGFAAEARRSYIESAAYRLRVRYLEWTFSAWLAWPASLAFGFLAFCLRDDKCWNSSYDMLNRVEARGRLFNAWRRVQEECLRRSCAKRRPAAVANRGRLEPIPADKAAGLILKLPTGTEKGVLLLKNTERIDAFRRSVDMPRLLAEYRLVLEPSWSGYSDMRILAFTEFREHPILVMSTSEDDFALLRSLNTNLTPIYLGASDWVHPQEFHPIPGAAKNFDAALIARWKLFKRHHLLFDAMHALADPSLRVALVARNIAGSSDRRSLLRQIEGSRLRSQIEIFEDLPPSQVNEVLNRSKVNLLLSRQEGSNRGLFEGFFAGVPGMAFANHLGIPKRHFNIETGKLIREPELAQSLLYFRANWSSYQPRTWALAHISPECSTAALNAELKKIAQSHNETWTTDILPKCNRPGIEYYPAPESGNSMPRIGELLTRFQLRPE